MLSALQNTLNNGSFILSLDDIGRYWVSEITLVASEQEHYHFTKNKLLLHMDEESLLYNIERLQQIEATGEFFPPEFYDSFHGGTKKQSLNLYAHLVDSANTIDLIDFLWNKDQLPLINGLVTAEGLYYPLSMDKNMPSFVSPFPFEKDTTNYLENFSNIDITKELLYQELHIFCGWGSFGGDGFVYVTDEKDKFQWVFFSEYCNPMKRWN